MPATTNTDGNSPLRRPRLPLRAELTLALLPTVTILAVLALVEAFSRQRLLFASLASSAFLIYLDPGHATNRVRTLVVAQGIGAGLGFVLFWALGPGYLTAALAMALTILALVLLNAVHPPAISTALGFAFRAGNESNLLLFGLAVGLIALLVGLQRGSQYLLRRMGSG